MLGNWFLFSQPRAKECTCACVCITQYNALLAIIKLCVGNEHYTQQLLILMGGGGEGACSNCPQLKVLYKIKFLSFVPTSCHPL